MLSTKRALTGKLSLPWAPRGHSFEKHRWKGERADLEGPGLPVAPLVQASVQADSALQVRKGCVEAAAGISRKQVRTCLDHRWWRWRCCGLVGRPQRDQFRTEAQARGTWAT